ncbi:MAG: high-potential iron-sulfur protein [Pseudomonadota bacterium]
MNRRNIIVRSALALPALAVASRGMASESSLLTAADPIAVALNYAEAAKTVDVSKHPKKAGPDGANQNCASCALYTEVKDGNGSCTAIPGKLVRGAGWCSAWVGRG